MIFVFCFDVSDLDLLVDDFSCYFRLSLVGI